MVLAAKLLDAGWPVLLDGAFSSAAQRNMAREAAARAGAPFVVIWCDAPDSVLADRLRRRAEQPGEVSDARVDLLPQHRAHYEPPERESQVVRIDTTASPDAAVRETLRALRVLRTTRALCRYGNSALQFPPTTRPESSGG
jgi:predicted kinase